jgi:hypothetical protein
MHAGLLRLLDRQLGGCLGGSYGALLEFGKRRGYSGSEILKYVAAGGVSRK